MNDRRSDLQNAFMFHPQPQATSSKIGDLREKVAQNKTILPSVQPDVVKLPRGRHRTDDRHASRVLRGFA